MYTTVFNIRSELKTKSQNQKKKKKKKVGRATQMIHTSQRHSTTVLFVSLADIAHDIQVNRAAHIQRKKTDTYAHSNDNTLQTRCRHNSAQPLDTALRLIALQFSSSERYPRG